jgi:heat shock protein HslJ
MTQLKHVLCLCAILLLGAVACDRNNGEPTLEATNWRLKSMIHNGTSKSVPDNLTITLSFQEEGAFRTTGTCNNMDGTYSVTEPDKVSLTPKNQTEMACDILVEWEIPYFELLGSSETYSIDNTTMTIECEGSNNNSLTFVQVN